MKQGNRSISGKIVGFPAIRTSKKGKDYLVFTLQNNDGGGLVSGYIFTDIDKAQALKAGTEVSLLGTYNKEGALLVNTWVSKNIKSQSKYISTPKDDNFVLVVIDGRKTWKKKEDCIFSNDHWWDKLELCFETLGAEHVAEEFRKFTIEHNISIYGRENLSRFPKKEYKLFLENLIKQAEFI